MATLPSNILLVQQSKTADGIILAYPKRKVQHFFDFFQELLETCFASSVASLSIRRLHRRMFLLHGLAEPPQCPERIERGHDGLELDMRHACLPQLLQHFIQALPADVLQYHDLMRERETILPHLREPKPLHAQEEANLLGIGFLRQDTAFDMKLFQNVPDGLQFPFIPKLVQKYLLFPFHKTSLSI